MEQDCFGLGGWFPNGFWALEAFLALEVGFVVDCQDFLEDAEKRVPVIFIAAVHGLGFNLKVHGDDLLHFSSSIPPFSCRTTYDPR